MRIEASRGIYRHQKYMEKDSLNAVDSVAKFSEVMSEDGSHDVTSVSLATLSTAFELSIWRARWPSR